jgi:hypothetical protein
MDSKKISCGFWKRIGKVGLFGHEATAKCKEKTSQKRKNKKVVLETGQHIFITFTSILSNRFGRWLLVCIKAMTL